MEDEIKNPEESVNEAQTSEIKEENLETEEPKKTGKRKTDFYIELALFLILGVLIGIAVKTEAIKKITIGFDDYKMKIASQDYDINKLQQDLAKQSAAATQGSDNTNTAPSDQNAGGDNSAGQGGSDNSNAPAGNQNAPSNN